MPQAGPPRAREAGRRGPRGRVLLSVEPVRGLKDKASAQSVARGFAGNLWRGAENGSPRLADVPARADGAQPQRAKASRAAPHGVQASGAHPRPSAEAGRGGRQTLALGALGRGGEVRPLEAVAAGQGPRAESPAAAVGEVSLAAPPRVQRAEGALHAGLRKAGAVRRDPAGAAHAVPAGESVSPHPVLLGW